MNVIFLDIDGVLNSTKTANPRKFPYIVDGRMVERLNELTAIARATVVLSSSWRVDPIGCLAAKHFGIHFDDVCPDMPKAARSEEIRCWLDRHPDAGRHIVIDDDDDSLDDHPLFQPVSSEGITGDLVEAAVAYFDGRRTTDLRRNAVVRFAQRIQSALSRDKS